MRKIEVLGIFFIFFLIVVITNISSSISVSTYEIKSSGEYYVPSDTYVRTTNFYCKSFTDKTKNESRVYHNNTELISMPDYASNYLFKVSSINDRKEANCEIYEYNKPSFDMTCTSTHLYYFADTKCDLYVTTSNFGIDYIKFNKNNNDLKIIDFDSLNFNMDSYNNEYTFIPKRLLNPNTKYLVGTITLTNMTKNDGKTNTLILDNIRVSDTVSSFKVDDIKQDFKEDEGDIVASTSTTSKTTVNPKTDIQYISAKKNSSSKTKFRVIIFLFIIVIVGSINLGLVIVYMMSPNKKRNE